MTATPTSWPVPIGEAARRAGVSGRMVRHYESLGLLAPVARTEAGYRLYAPEAADTVRLIQRAQRLGFSLAEIRALLAAWRAGDLDDAALLATAEARYLALERQITEWRVQQHELELFLQDLRGPDAAAAQTAFLDGGDWAYAAGILAVGVGAAIVFFLFPRREKENELLAEYAAEDA